MDSHRKYFPAQFRRNRWLLAAFFPWCLVQVQVLAEGFADWASTPPMGWNSWDAYGQSVTESEVRANADYMAANLKPFGWEYVVVDIRWTVPNPTFIYNSDATFTLDGNGRFLPASNRFPSAVDGQGFKPIADYLHSQGLKFGIHIMRGIPKAAVNTSPTELPNGYPIAGSTYTTKDVTIADGSPWLGDMYGVANTPAGQAYYNSIFQLYSDWGVDYVKVDDTALDANLYHADEVAMIRSAIDATGRPMVLSTSPGPPPSSAGAHLSQNANAWRVSGDVWDEWGAIYNQLGALSMWTPYRSPGHWPDGDMLPIGRIAIRSQVGFDRMTKLTHDEQRTMMTLWSIARSPLMFGGDLPSNDAWTNSLLTNQEVLGVNQRSTNNRELFRNGNRVGWVADAPGGGKYLALFNASPADELGLLRSNADYTSPIITRNTPGQSVDIDVDITGSDHLYLLVGDGGNGIAADWADWADMQLHGPSGSIPLTDLTWVRASAGYGTTNEAHNVIGGPLVINGVSYADGIGTHANSIIEYQVPEGFTSLTGRVGLDQQGASQLNFNPSIQFFVTASDGPIGGSDLQFNVALADLGLAGDVKVRDLWSHTNLGTIQGQFSSSIPWHGAGLYRLIEAPTLLGDYNHDGGVDAGDYVVWRESRGSTDFLAADGNGDFVVNEDDYLIWRAHFGELSSGLSAAGETAQVPEPATAPLVLTTVFGVLQSLRRTRARS